ncbi:amidohydrolase family protein [Kribbella italica]|uniref:Putative TIM-barrel fold metal-dependent hydrolase n=1 Tax=Kribbella italica TaxID=1540520 RepID=A0A7W9JCD9_9ACTN|nr:amidohydrolase family protein [Kribbella italica]MBB5839569.1 putative TIM-barrel fold metal-dependent hydrolase [Kribbella italica]
MIGRRPPAGRQVIDVHAHLGPYSLFHIPEPGARQMVDVMDRTGTQVAVVAANRGIQQDAHLGNTETLAAVDAHPGRIAAYAVINPWQDPDRELERLAADDRFVGIKVHPSLHQYPVTGARYAAVWAFAAETGCPVLSHSEHRSAYDAPVLFETVADRYPDAQVILGHAGISPAGVDEAVAAASRHSSLWLEVCGSQMTGQLITGMVEQVGSRRVLFGSDFPFIDQRMSLGRVVYASLTEDEREDVLGGNAHRLFRWRPLPGDPGEPR